MSPFVGIEIGGTKLQVVASHDIPRIQRIHRTGVIPARGVEGILSGIEEGLEEVLQGREPQAIGVAFGGPLDRHLLRIIRSHQVPGWDGFPLGQWLRERHRVPIVLENDANAAALAEGLCGAGQGTEPVLYVTLGSGVGGGLFTRKALYHGAPPAECEIGHLRLDGSGRILESSCSGWAVDRKVRESIRERPDGPLARHAADHPEHEAIALTPALEENDPDAIGILRSTAEDLAFGLSHAVHLMSPQVIVLGGGLSLIGEPFRRAVSDALPRWVMEAMHPPPRIILSGLGEEVVPTGALLLAQGRHIAESAREPVTGSA